MRTLPRGHLAGVTAAIAALLGCASSPAPSGTQPTPEPGGSQPYALSSLDAPCDGAGGPTGAMVLAATRPAYETTLVMAGSGAETPLAITIARAGGPILCHPAIHAAPGMGMPDRLASVDVPVTIGFATADGVFAEHLATVLSGDGRGAAAFARTLSPAELEGTFDPGLAGYEDVAVSISGTFAGDRTQGTVGKSGHRPGMASESFPFVAAWGSAP